MKRLTNSKKMLTVLGAGLLVSAASGTAFAMQTRNGNANGNTEHGSNQGRRHS